VKIGIEQFWKTIIHATNGKAQHALMIGSFIFLFGGCLGEVFFLFFFLVQSMALPLAQAKNGDKQFWE
jgi:hypothetical protein